MAWLECSDEDESLKLATDGTASGMRRHRCVADANVGLEDALDAVDPETAMSPPAPGTSWSMAYPGLRCKSQQFTREGGNGAMVIVVSNYESEAATDGGAVSTIASPEDRAPKWAGRSSRRSEPYFFDHSSTPKASVNSAGEPFADAPTRDAGDIELTVTFNLLAMDPEFFDDALHRVNDASVTATAMGKTFAAGELRFVEFSFSEHVETFDDEPVHFYKVTLGFAYKKGGWIDKPLNVGFNELVTNGSVKELRPILDRHGKPVSKPWPLNTDGSKKTGSPPTIDVIELVPYAEASYTALVAGAF